MNRLCEERSDAAIQAVSPAAPLTIIPPVVFPAKAGIQELRGLVFEDFRTLTLGSRFRGSDGCFWIQMR